MSVTNVAVVFWYKHGEKVNTLVANETKDVTEYLKNNEKMLKLVHDKETTNSKKLIDAKRFFATEAKKFTKMKIIPNKDIQFGEVTETSDGNFKTTYRFVPDEPRFTIINGPVLNDETPLEAIERIIIEATGYKIKQPELFLIETKHDEKLQGKTYTIFTHEIKAPKVYPIFKAHLKNRQAIKHRGMYSNFKFVDPENVDLDELTGYSYDILDEFVKKVEVISFYNELAKQGWQRVYSEKNKEYYWYNSKTDETTWNNPGVKVTFKKSKSKSKKSKTKRGGRETRKVKK